MHYKKFPDGDSILDTLFAIEIWWWHNIAFVLMCILIAKAFYQASTTTKALHWNERIIQDENRCLEVKKLQQ